MSGICDTCGDDRFELIATARAKLLDATNIESRPEEVAVLDSILFRCWQMGWLDQLRESYGQVHDQGECEDEGERESYGSRWHELFGTPERAARTLGVYFIEECSGVKCVDCPFYSEGDYLDCLIARRNDDTLLEWLRGDA